MDPDGNCRAFYMPDKLNVSCGNINWLKLDKFAIISTVLCVASLMSVRIVYIC